MLQTAIKEAREKAGRAIQAARELGEKMRKEPEKAGELDEQFKRAHGEATESLKTVQRLEAELELEAASQFMAQPGPEQRTQHQSDAKPVIETVAREQLRKAQHRAALVSFLRTPREGNAVAAAMEHLKDYTPQERHALVGTQGDLGGFAISDEMKAEVLKDMAQMSVMRSICRVERTGKPALVFPTIKSATGGQLDIYSSDYAGSWKQQGYVTGGTAPTVQNKPQFGQERIPVHGWQPDAIEVTNDLLEDSDANIESILAEVIAETRSLDEDSAFTTGNGVGRPEGFINGGSPNPETDLGTASTFTYAGLMALYTALPGQYRQNGTFVMNSATYGKLLLLETTAGFPLFPPNSLPGTLFTKPVVFNEFMASVASAAKTIVFGDFRRAYIIVDRSDLRLQRLTERFAPNIGILPVARIGGQVVRPRALRIGKHAA